MLWITPDPGCGKSVLARSLVDKELQNTESHTVCYFFKDNKEQNSIYLAICALLHQLFRRKPKLLHHAIASWEANDKKLSQEVDEVWRILMAAANDPATANVICVLDALYECQEFERRKFIRLPRAFHLESMLPSQRKLPRQCQLKFLLTSRPYSDIEREFRGLPNDPHIIRLSGEEQNDRINKEISLFIKAMVSEISHKLRLKEKVNA